MSSISKEPPLPLLCNERQSGMKLSFVYPLLGCLSLFIVVHPVRGHISVRGKNEQQQQYETDTKSHNDDDEDADIEKIQLWGGKWGAFDDQTKSNDAAGSYRPWPLRVRGQTPMRRKPHIMKAEHTDKKVVIVGAGYAGWGAARRLVEGGMRAEDITIIEADDDFGGRTRKDDSFMPFPLDLGASFIRRDFRSELATISGVQKKDLPLTEVKSQGWGWCLWNNATTYYGFLSNNIVSKLGACGINTEYECKVTSVNYEQADTVETRCENGNSFISSQVIVTVPLSVLKEGDIEFNPVLPHKIQQNIDKRVWDGGFKIFLEFDTGFNPYDWFCFPNDECTEFDENGEWVGEHIFWDYTRFSAHNFDGKRNLVAGYFIGTYADEFDGMDEGQIVKRVLKKINDYHFWEGKYHRGYQPDRYKRHLIINWSDHDNKQFVRGHDSPGRSHRQFPFVRGICSQTWDDFEGHRSDHTNKVFMAGEAFPAPLDDNSDGYEEECWVFTALHSGEKAAEMILDLPSDIFHAGQEESGPIGGNSGGVQQEG